MRTPALRAHFLREESGMSALDVSLKRVCTCYWALARTPRHSVIAPVDVLTALILQRPQLGGALQQDVGEVFAMLPPCTRHWYGFACRWTRCVCGRYRAGAAEHADA